MFGGRDTKAECDSHEDEELQVDVGRFSRSRGKSQRCSSPNETLSPGLHAWQAKEETLDTILVEEASGDTSLDTPSRLLSSNTERQGTSMTANTKRNRGTTRTEARSSLRSQSLANSTSPAAKRRHRQGRSFQSPIRKVFIELSPAAKPPFLVDFLQAKAQFGNAARRGTEK